jgi:hypothetical protein
MQRRLSEEARAELSARCERLRSELVLLEAELRTDQALALQAEARERVRGSERPRLRLSAQPRAVHSITSSARASSMGGMVRPSALAVIILIVRSNLVGCSTGKSAGFAPRKILSTYSAPRRNSAGKFAP